MSSSNLPRPEPRQQAANIARLKSNVQRVADVVRKLKQQTDVAAFSHEQLRAEFGISMQQLNVVTGDPCSHGQAYIKPVPPEVVTEWLKKYAPEESEDLESFDIDFPDLDATELSPGFDFHEAAELSDLLLNRVKYSKDSDMGVMMGKESHWNEAELPDECISLSHSDWEAREPFHQVHPSQYGLDFDCVTKSNPALPHMQCWLADDLPVKNGPYLSPAELITTLGLAIAKIKAQKYYQPTVIPVSLLIFSILTAYRAVLIQSLFKITVFSCSARKLRIVQGAINFHTLDLDFRYSPVIDFSVGGLHSNSQNAKAVAGVLGWVLGRPVGQTFPGRNQ
ncbi:hypothetical protein NHJ13051_005269 [Beauveria bassiana]